MNPLGFVVVVFVFFFLFLRGPYKIIILPLYKNLKKKKKEEKNELMDLWILFAS